MSRGIFPNSTAARVREWMKGGQPFTHDDVATEFNTQPMASSTAIAVLMGQGAEFDVTKSATGKKTFRMTKQPAHPDMLPGEAIALARQDKHKAPKAPKQQLTHDPIKPEPGARGRLRADIRERLLNGEQLSLLVLSAFYPDSVKSGLRSAFQGARDGLIKEGYQLERVKGLRPLEILWFVGNLSRGRELALVDEEPAYAPPPLPWSKLPVPPRLGTALEVTAQRRIGDEIHMVISENGDAWSVVVTGHTAAH